MYPAILHKALPLTVSIPTMLLLSALWMLSGCVQQSVRDDTASVAQAVRDQVDEPPEPAVKAEPPTPKIPKSPAAPPESTTSDRVELQSDTDAAVQTLRPSTAEGSPQSPSTVAAPHQDPPGGKPDVEPVTKPSGDAGSAPERPAGTAPDTTRTTTASPAVDVPDATRTSAPPDPTQADTMQIDLESLPLSFGAGWALDRRPNPATKRTECILASPAVNIPDGYDRTNVQVLLTLQSIYINADSNIDLSYPESGIRIGAGALRPFDRLVRETTAVISGGGVKSLYTRMANSSRMVVRLGFWPTWPATETREVSYSLGDFQHAITALHACNRM